MVDLTLMMLYETSSNSFSYIASGGIDTDVLYPFHVTQGITNYTPGSPMVAQSGEAVFYLDNLGSDFPWSDTNATTGQYTNKGLGSYFIIDVLASAFTSDYGDSDIDFVLFQGRAEKWDAVPGLFEDRVVEVVLKDYIYDLSHYPVSGLSVAVNQNANGLLSRIAAYSDTAMMPYDPPVQDYSTAGETFPLAWYDVRNGQTRALTAVSKIAGSELGHFHLTPNSFATQSLDYLTHDEWIELGSSVLATFDNQWLAIDMDKTREYELSPIFVKYTPTKTADTDVVLFSFNSPPTIQPGKTWRRIANYRDPSNLAVGVAVIDSDIVTPVSGTDYVFSGVASSDLSVSLSNMGSAGVYVITNNGTANAVFTTVQVRGKPVYRYNDVAITSTDVGSPSANALNIDLSYVADEDFAESVLNFYNMAYNRYPEKPIIKSITFQAGADSDAWAIARGYRPGKLIHIIEDVNSIDDDYRIMGASFDFMSCNDVPVTFYVHPNEYMVLHMIDGGGTIPGDPPIAIGEQHMTDSDGRRFAFWR